MPIKKYDRYYGGHAAQALKAMTSKYGARKGRQVFYATLQKRRHGSRAK